ncbi:MAG: 6-hydroxymethylpterin diphosphokinase MptE-like protein [Chitinophagaceae bacterium]
MKLIISRIFSLKYWLKEVLTHWILFFKVKKMHNRKKIMKFKNIHKNEVVFCLGAGPSLNKENLSLLNGEIVIFTNSSYKLLERISPKNKYWFVQDQYRLNELNSVDKSLFDASFKSLHNLLTFKRDNILDSEIFIQPEFLFKVYRRIYIPQIVEAGIKFSTQLHERVNLAGNSVIFSAIQLAYYMGAKKIVLLGVDMNYGMNPQQSYFDKDSINNISFWPISYENNAKPAFLAYRELLDSRGVQLINSTCETKEDVLLKVPLERVKFH